MESGLLRQVTITLLVSTVALSSGMSAGWLFPMTPTLRRFDSPVGRMTKQEISYLATLPLYVGFFISFFYGFVAKKLGRKDAMMCVGIPSIVSGFVLIFARSKAALYVGRSFAGCTMVGGIMASFMYVSETVDNSLRGTLMAILAFQFNLGVLLSYVLGTSLSYETFNIVCIAVPSIYSILMLWLPESPHFLVNYGRIKDAMRSLLWLKKGNHISAKLELESIKPDPTAKRNPSIIQIFKSKGSRTAFVVSLLAYVFQGMSGILVIFANAETIFKDDGSYFSPENYSSVAIALLILVSSLLGVFLIDSAGRKPLLYVSLVGSCISLAILSSFLYIGHKGTDVTNLGWISITSVSFFAVCYAVGLGTVPSVLTNELVPPNVKPVVCSMIAAVTVGVVIAVLQTSTVLQDTIGLYFVFAISSTFNLIGIFYTWLMVPETSGKSLKVISQELKGERILSVIAGRRV